MIPASLPNSSIPVQMEQRTSNAPEKAPSPHASFSPFTLMDAVPSQFGVHVTVLIVPVPSIVPASEFKHLAFIFTDKITERFDISCL